jgi:hypothetical protein
MATPTTSKRETVYFQIGTGVYVRASVSKAMYVGEIGTAIGAVTEAPTTGTIVAARPSNVLNGRFVASGKNGSNKRRSFRYMCPPDKLEEAMTAAMGKTVDGFKIDTVRSPRKVVYV